MIRGQERRNYLRDTLVTYFPMFIATVSVLASLYQFNKGAEVLQYNATRVEAMRSCRDLIESYFTIKLKAGEAANGSAQAQHEAATAVARFSAIATFLANVDEKKRLPYTNLAHELARTVGSSNTLPPAEVEKLFQAIDRQFTDVNEDCVRTAKTLM